MSNEYASLKHDLKLTYLNSNDQSVGMFHLNDLGPSFDGDPLFALQVSLALTYENVDQIIVGEHVETQEELEEMKRDRDFVLNSGKLNYEDAFRDEADK